VNEGGLKAIKAIVGGAVLLLLLVTVVRWYGDFRISSTEKVLEETTSTPTGENTEATNPETPTSEEEVPADTTGDQETPVETKTVVVLTDGLNFRKEPKKGSDVIRGLDKGEKLVLVKSQSGWYQVKDGAGVTGWISASPSYTRLQ
jgi:uncharacterized protein YgiM (DUF1202 family)